jgi:hypothetical protein
VRRAIALTVGAALVWVAVAWPAASAEFRGTDLVSNISPESQSAGGLVDRFPLSAYSLDYHVDVGVTDPGGVPPMIAQWAAAQIWSVTSFLVKTVVDLFTWAFSLDLLGGSQGVLAPIANAITSLYENVIGEAWMVAAILVAGLWGIWKALVQRRYTETAGALAVSVVFMLIALFFVYQPERTIGEASGWTNTLSLAFLSGANRGSLDDPEQAKRQVADHIFETLVYRPWVVLEFGGLRHCVDSDRLDKDGFPRPVGPHDPSRDVCRDHLQQDRSGHGGYAERYLRQPAGSEERKAEYDAIREGEAPPFDRQFAGYRVDKTDSPAVDIQQEGGAYQRLTFAVIVFLGALGAIALLGFLSLAVILAQVVALVLLGFAPVALIIGIFPGAGHAFFRSWLTKLATAVFIKALYSLVIAIVVAVSAALAASTDSLGFLFAFGLQTLFFWAIFLYRKQITGRLVSATTGAADGPQMPRTTVVQRGAHIAARPFTALVGVGRSREEDTRQESALAGAPTAHGPDSSDRPAEGAREQAGAPAAAGNGHAPLVRAATNGVGRSSPAPGASNGNGDTRVAASGDPLPTNGASAQPAAGGAVALGPARAGDQAPEPVAAGRGQPGSHAPEPSPRASHEDVMRRARELREHQRTAEREERGG